MWFFSGRKKRIKVAIDKSSTNARKVLSKLGVTFVKNLPEADLVWFRKQELYEDIFPNLVRNQLLNHIPGERGLINKGKLIEHLKIWDKRGVENQELDSFFPETYRLYVWKERKQFLSRLPQKNDGQDPWVLKPTNLSKGRGIQILNDYDKIREICRAPSKNLYDPDDSPTRKYVIQRYIKNVLLLDSRKSEIRIYWLVACRSPLLVLMYKEGTVRLNTLPFKMGDFDNPLVHVTNVFQQKNHPDYDPKLALKWDFNALDRYVSAKAKVEQSFIQEKLRPRLIDCLKFVARATQKTITSERNRGLCFGLYGADFILDSQLNPWLTEVQIGPGLSFDDPIKKKVIPPMLQDAVRIALEVQRRRRNKESLSSISDIGGFEWVVNDAKS